MKKSLVYAFSAALLGSAAIAAHADTGECDKYTTSYDKTYCFAKLFMESDKELNSVYNDLHNTVKGPIKQQLKESELEWIKYRDRSCEQSGNINVGCNYRVNRERTEYLRDRLRECKAGTCRNDMIGQHAWE